MCASYNGNGPLRIVRHNTHTEYMRGDQSVLLAAMSPSLWRVTYYKYLLDPRPLTFTVQTTGIDAPLITLDAICAGLLRSNKLKTRHVEKE